MRKTGISALMALFVVSSIAVPALALLMIDLNTNNVFGSVDVSTGVATVSGTLWCSAPSNAQVFGALTQQKPMRTETIGTFSVAFRCDGETPWTAMVIESFLPGPAKVIGLNAMAYSDTGEFIHIRRPDVDVILIPQNKKQ